MKTSKILTNSIAIRTASLGFTPF